ncbi:MAG TPA: hypothetical protein VNS63_04570 [Blastocatellia bacterium]|nr:hypothetical protein [Blastocatellia bacterium]
MAQTNYIRMQPQSVRGGGFRRESSLGGAVRGIFKCRHRELSRPFTLSGETYRVCLDCGARRGFRPDTWTTQGGYYWEDLATSQVTNSVRRGGRRVRERDGSGIADFRPGLLARTLIIFKELRASFVALVEGRQS